MRKLVAKRPVLYHGRNYRRGEALPTEDEAMTEAWLRAGSAAWEGPAEYEDIVPPAPGAPVDGALPGEDPPAKGPPAKDKRTRKR